MVPGTSVGALQFGELVPIASRDAFLAAVPELAGAWVADVDLRDLDVDWRTLHVTGATFAGCGLTAGAETDLRERGAMVLPPFDSFEFSPYRSSLYTNAELMEGYEPGRPETTRDAKIGTWSLEPPEMPAALARGMHDACIDAALVRFLTEIGPVVGIMGGHALPRSAPQYRDVAELGRLLTRAGLTVATGGGPGLMEAANLGAWLAHAPPDALDDALRLLVRAPPLLR